MIPASALKKIGDLLVQVGQAMRGLGEGNSHQGLNLAIPVLKCPKHIPKDEEWFWSKEWQKGEREVNAALRRGDYHEFDNVDALLADLRAQP